MKRGMVKKTFCIMMVMVLCLTSISLTAFADEGADSICEDAANDSQPEGAGKNSSNEEDIKNPSGEDAGNVSQPEDVVKTSSLADAADGSSNEDTTNNPPSKDEIEDPSDEKDKDPSGGEDKDPSGEDEPEDPSMCKEAPDKKHAPNRDGIGELIKKATCTEDGECQLKCRYCNEWYSEVIPATGHTAVVDPKVEATCTTTGLTEGSHCSVCREILKKQEVIPTTGHTPGQKKLSQKGTCKTPEKWIIQCLIDGSLWEETGTYGPHKWTTVKGVEATCTENGLTEGSLCSVCGKIQKAQETITATGHNYSSWQLQPENTGLFKTRKCLQCGNIQKESIIENLQLRSPADSNCVFLGKDGKELKKISDKIQFYTSTSDDGAENVLYTDNSGNSQLKNFSAESEDGIHNLAVMVGESGTIQMNSPDGTKQMGISMSLIDRDKTLLFFNENNRIATVTDIKKDGNSVILESENGNELTISSENVKYEVGDISDSDDSYIVAEQVEGKENTVRLSTQSADSISEEQKESEKEESKQTEESTTDELTDTTEIYGPVEIVFGIHIIQEETTEANTEPDTGKIEQFTEDDENKTIEKFEEESPSYVIVRFDDPEAEKEKEEEKKEEEKSNQKKISFNFEYLETACQNRKYGSCEFTEKKDDYTHICKHKKCYNTEQHQYSNGCCWLCGAGHKNHIWNYDTHFDTCKVCGGRIAHNHTWIDSGDGLHCKCSLCGEVVSHEFDKAFANIFGGCKCRACGYLREHHYKYGTCTYCHYEHGENEAHRYNRKGVCSVCGKKK